MNHMLGNNLIHVIFQRNDEDRWDNITNKDPCWGEKSLTARVGVLNEAEEYPLIL